jgi:hypothetical protein
MRTQSVLHRRVFSPVLALALSIAGVCTAQTTPPDLTASGAIAALKTNANGNATPVYGDTFNLGPTGLRGWIHLNFSGFDYQASGRISDASRQILVTTSSSPGNVVLAVDDVILGAIAASSGTVPSFTSDARKAFGTAITEAEKTGAGTLRVKRWRAGTTTDVNITIPTLGTYSATAPYNCPKSAQILANTRNQMVGELIADPNYLGGGHSGAINALALLASVPYVVNPGDPNESNYSQARTRLQTYARSLSVPAYQWEPDQETWIWEAAYQLVFLSEYYLLTNDSQVVPTINGFTLWLSEFQSMWGTYNHGPGGLLQDGSGRRFANGYGPVNAVGNVANLSIVLGKKAWPPASPSIRKSMPPSNAEPASSVPTSTKAASPTANTRRPCGTLPTARIPRRPCSSDCKPTVPSKPNTSAACPSQAGSVSKWGMPDRNWASCGPFSVPAWVGKPPPPHISNSSSGVSISRAARTPRSPTTALTSTITAEAPPPTALIWEIPQPPVSKAPPSTCSPTASRSNSSTSPGKT